MCHALDVDPEVGAAYAAARGGGRLCACTRVSAAVLVLLRALVP